MKRVCVIIPIYNTIPTNKEIESINRNTDVLSNYDIYAVCPESMDISEYKKYRFTDFLRFDDKYFVSNKSYSRLIMSEAFYKPIIDYEYLLIAQTDTFILNTSYSLEEFMDKDFDYIGAPWPKGPFDLPYGLREYFKSLFISNPRELHVGNGGFSLRKVKSSYDTIVKHKLYIKYIWRLNEDLFFSTRLNNIAPVEVAAKFALETNMQEEINKGNHPYALHAYEKYLDINVSELLKSINSYT